MSQPQMEALKCGECDWAYTSGHESGSMQLIEAEGYVAAYGEPGWADRR